MKANHPAVWIGALLTLAVAGGVVYAVIALKPAPILSPAIAPPIATPRGAAPLASERSPKAPGRSSDPAQIRASGLSKDKFEEWFRVKDSLQFPASVNPNGLLKVSYDRFRDWSKAEGYFTNDITLWLSWKGDGTGKHEAWGNDITLFTMDYTGDIIFLIDGTTRVHIEPSMVEGVYKLPTHDVVKMLQAKTVEYRIGGREETLGRNQRAILEDALSFLE
ncbi:MAG TPA: hypothetical protein VFF65_07560 [Phycisphaerales bacterium]|nr:hypothetical protein [Phycisphaerales bacterium]